MTDPTVSREDLVEMIRPCLSGWTGSPELLAAMVADKLISSGVVRGQAKNNSIARAQDRVLEQACEDVGACGASDELRVAVHDYYVACGDDEMAADLAQELGLPAPPIQQPDGGSK